MILVIANLLALNRHRRRNLDKHHLHDLEHLFLQVGRYLNRCFAFLEEIRMLLYRLALHRELPPRSNLTGGTLEGRRSQAEDCADDRGKAAVARQANGAPPSPPS